MTDRGGLAAIALALTATAALFPACGAEPDAPAPVELDASRACPSVTGLAPGLMGMLDRGELPGIARLLGETLTRDQLSSFLDGVFRIVRQLPGEKLADLIELLRSDRIAPAWTLVEGLVDYAQTGGPDGGLNTPLLDELAFALGGCGGRPLFQALDAALSSGAVLPLAEPLRETLATPVVQTLLSSAGALNREHLADFLGNLEAALVLPGADPQASARHLLSTVTALTDILSQPPVSTFVDGGLALLSPSGALFPPVQDLLCCDLYGTETCPDVSQSPPLREAPSVYAYLAYDVFLSHPERLDPVLVLLSDATLTARLAPLVDVLTTLARDPDERTALLRLAATLLRHDVATQVLPELSRVLASGGLDELLDVAAAVVEGCPSPGGDR